MTDISSPISSPSSTGDTASNAAINTTSQAAAAPSTDHTAAPNIPQLATITGSVSYRPGDGAMIEIPRGPVEVALAPDSATLSWEAGEGVAGLTAIPRTQFDDYVRKGDIKLVKPAPKKAA